MFKKLYLLGILFSVVSCELFSAAVIAQERPKKKIVEYGWDVPYPDFVAENIR